MKTYDEMLEEATQWILPLYNDCKSVAKDILVRTISICYEIPAEKVWEDFTNRLTNKTK